MHFGLEAVLLALLVLTGSIALKIIFAYKHHVCDTLIAPVDKKALGIAQVR